METCIAVLPGFYAVNAVCRVACLAWRRWIGELMLEIPGRGSRVIPLKPHLQKRIRNGLTAVEIT